MAAWSATEDFEYSVGLLNTQSGGSGWSAGWSADAGLTVVSSPTFSGTGACGVGSGLAGCDGSRTLTTAVNSGIVRVYFYATNLPTAQKGFYPAVLKEGGTARFYVAWGANPFNDNEIGILGSTSISLSTSLSAATWYYIDIELDQAGGSRARVSLNGGAWSSYVTANGGSFTTIDSYRITSGDGNATDQGYVVDNIGVGTGPAAAAVSIKRRMLTGIA